MDKRKIYILLYIVLMIILCGSALVLNKGVLLGVAFIVSVLFSVFIFGES